MSINLSFSTLNMLHTSSHNWINRICDRKVPDNIYFEMGRKIHRIVQDHVSGIKLDERLNIPYTFDIVERMDRDPKCKISFKINDRYNMIGYFDGYNTKEKRTLEIKSAGTMWTLGDFQRSMQRRIYSIAKPEVVENLLITLVSDTDKWIETPPKIYQIPVTQKDKDEAMQWILDGIKIIESGDFTGGLTDGVCTDYRCYYGDNCLFRI